LDAFAGRRVLIAYYFMWRTKTYLRPEQCEHPERGCPVAALAPELARADKGMKPRIVAELVNYKSQMLPFMPGRRTVDKERAFFAIFSTRIGAVENARMLPNPAMREKVLASTRDFLLRGFGAPQSWGPRNVSGTRCRFQEATLQIGSIPDCQKKPPRNGLVMTT